MALGASRLGVFASGVRRILALLGFGYAAGLALTFAAQRLRRESSAGRKAGQGTHYTRIYIPIKAIDLVGVTV